MPATPDRVTISLLPDDDLDKEQLEQLVEQSDHSTISEYIRHLIRNDVDLDELGDPELLE